MRLFYLASLTLLTLLSSVPTLHAQDADDAKALQEVEKLLNDPAMRADAAKGNPNALASEAFFGKFPSYAQKELNEIVMMIMKESKAGSQKHVDAHKSGGAQAAYNSFSPAVKARVQALERKLASDPKFNNPENMQMMKSFFPQFLGSAPK